MIRSVIQNIFRQIMSEQEKKEQRIQDVFNAETNPRKIFEIIGVSLWLPSSPDLNAFG